MQKNQIMGHFSNQRMKLNIDLAFQFRSFFQDFLGAFLIVPKLGIFGKRV